MSSPMTPAGSPTGTFSAGRGGVVPSLPAATSQAVDLTVGDIFFKGLRGLEPLLLLPLRVETRFADSAGGPQLWVRIFPDQIAIDSHDPDLTTDEWVGAQQYWKAMWPLTASQSDARQKAWSDLAAAFGPRRAAYVARSTGPMDFDAWVSSPAAAVLGTGRAVPTAPGTLRPSSWSKPAVARALPTQWFVMLTSGSTTQVVEVIRPKADLVVSPDPGAAGALGSAGGPTDAMSWLSDFNQAQRAGMAVAVNITREQRAAGFDRLIVFGITGDSGSAGQTLLEDLLRAHRFTDGMAFVPQGMATKNSTDSVSGYTRSDPTFAESFKVECAGDLIARAAAPLPDLMAAACSDGQMFAGLLGIDPVTVAHTKYADRTDQHDAAAMATAAWPATGDYFLRYLTGYTVTPAERELIREFVTQYVRGRGLLPAFRVGTTPYGIAPVTVLADLTKGLGFDRVAAQTAAFVQKARGVWEDAVRTFPVQVKPGPNTTPEQALANVLGRDASSVTVNARLDFGPWLTWNLAQWDISAGFGLSLSDTSKPERQAMMNAGESLAGTLKAAQEQAVAQSSVLGWTGPSGPVSGFVYFAPLGSNLPHVTADGQVSESTFLPRTHFVTSRHHGVGSSLVRPVNVLEFLCNLSVTGLLSFIPKPDDLTLLMAVVRQALLLEYATAAAKVLNRTLHEPEKYTQPPGQQPDTLLWALAQTVYTPPAGLPAASGTLGDYLQAQVQTLAGRSALPAVAALLDAVMHLSTMSTAALDRVLIESLDTCSYRLDAWASAVAARVLFQYRARAASGLALGVWSYLENLRPAPAQTLSEGDLAALATATAAGGVASSSSALAPAKDTTGFILAPSLDHAATGAILRNGYLSNSAGTYGSAFAVDLSSARVRAAKVLMEGIGQGQPLGALLGYLFEQGLNDAGLQVLLQPFRNAYPIVANKMGQHGAGPADAVAASNVVDGAALQGAWEAGTVPWGQGDLPASDGSDPSYPIVTALLDMLSDRVDALSDIAVAESIYQVAKGNPARSGGALNVSSRDQHPSQPQVIETPRGGLDLTQRVMSTFAVDPVSPPASTWLGSVPATPRAAAEPWLESWVGALLPPPANVRFQLTYTPASGGAAITTSSLTLATVGLGALDLLALSPPPPSGAAAGSLDGSDLAGTDLDRWILAQCLANGSLPVGSTSASVVYQPSAPPPLLTIPQLLTLVRSLQELIGAARPVIPMDFVSPATAVPASSLDLSGVAGRLTLALASLRTLATALSNLLASFSGTLTSAEGDALSLQLLNAAAFGFPGAAPATTGRDAASLAALLAQAGRINTALGERLTALTANANLYGASSGLTLSTSSTPTLKLAQDTAEAIFGPKFMVLPVITPPTSGAVPDPLLTAVNNLASGIAAWGATGPLPVANVLQQLTHVRPPLARLDESLSLSAVLVGTPVADFAVAQLGGSAAYAPTNPWLGIGPVSARFPWQTGSPPQSLLGSYALLVWTPPTLGSATGASMCGLFFDEWIEQIPNSTEKVAVAFHYAEPGARAPQSLLLAVAPPTQDNWSARLMRDCVLEAVALAKIRTVDPQTLELGGQVGQLLPALFAGLGAYTVSSLIPSVPTSTDPVGS